MCADQWGEVAGGAMRWLGLAIVGITFAVSACGDDGEEEDAEQAVTFEVVAQDMAFVPDSLETHWGPPMEFTVSNRDTVAHSFRIYLDTDEQTPSWSLGTVQPGETTTGTTDFRPCAPCDFVFICDIHPDQMQGTLRAMAD